MKWSKVALVCLFALAIVPNIGAAKVSYTSGTINIWSSGSEDNCSSLFTVTGNTTRIVTPCISPFASTCVYVDASVNITRGGATNWTNFSVQNCEIRMNMSSNGNNQIYSWGNFTINKANITTNDSSKYTEIIVQPNSNFSMNDSFISQAGWADNPNQRGLELNSPVFKFRNNTLANNYNGLTLYSGANGCIISGTDNVFNVNEGIYIFQSDNHSFYNINTSYNQDYGLLLYTDPALDPGSGNNTFTNVNSDWNANSGVFISGSSNNTFNNISVNNNLRGMEFDSTSSNNTIMNANVSFNTGGGNRGIKLYANSKNNIFINVNASYQAIGVDMTTNSNNVFNGLVLISNTNTGISLTSNSNNNTLINVTATSNPISITFDTSSNNTIFGADLWGCTTTVSGCIYFTKSENNTIISSRINNTKKFLVDIRQSNNTFFQDTQFINVSVLNGAINLTLSSKNNVFLNCSFINITEAVSANSQLLRQWYVDVKVNNSAGHAEANANVTITNISGAIMFYGFTNSTGWLSRINLTSYQNVSGILFNNSFFNITINSTTSAFNNGTKAFDLSNNQINGNLFYTMLDTTPPAISSFSAYHFSNALPLVLRGSNVSINATVFDAGGIDKVILNLSDNESKTVYYGPMENTSLTSYGHSLWLNTTSSLGNWSINITVNDTSQNNASQMTNFTVADPAIAVGSGQQFNAYIGYQVSINRTDAVTQVTGVDYSQITINLSIPNDTVSVKLFNSSGVQPIDLINYTGGYVIFNVVSIGALELQPWTLSYNVSKISYAVTDSLVVLTRTRYVTVNGNTTTIKNVLANASVNETLQTLTLLIYSSGLWVDITNNPTYSFTKYDTNFNGFTDKVTWVIPFLDSQKQYRIDGFIGNPLNITRFPYITNLPVTTNKNIRWRENITFINLNPTSLDFAEKIRPPDDATELTMDGLAAQQFWDAFGRYVIVADTLPLNGSVLHYMEYKTDAVTILDKEYNYPDTYRVDSLASVSLNVSVKNWASLNISDVQNDIYIPYGQNLFLCDGFVSCNSSTNFTDSVGLISGTYTLKENNISAQEIKLYTITYDIPTAISNLGSKYRESDNGTVLVVQPVHVESRSPIPMNNVDIELKGINCSNVVSIINRATKASYNFTCGSVIVHLGSLSTTDVLDFDVKYIESGAAPVTINLTAYFWWLYLPISPPFGFTLPFGLGDRVYSWHLFAIAAVILVIYAGFKFELNPRNLRKKQDSYEESSIYNEPEPL